MDRTPNTRFSPLAYARIVCAAGAALALALAFPAAVTPARAETSTQTPTVTTVTIERERPVREKLPTLRFLKANRDFIRARFDNLRQDSRQSAAGAGELDPRFLAYRQMLLAIAAGKDSVTISADARERAALFASVDDLGKLERELDQMERLLDAQRARLGVLQGDFAGRQRTELDVIVTGGALVGQVDSVVVTLEDGSRIASALNETQRQSLKHGGTFEVFHGLVEPREQVLDVAFLGEGWSAVGHGFITLEPARDRLTFLKLDLAQAQPARGITSVMAGTWLLEPELPTADAGRNRP
jgi:hypothetical protein